MMSRSFYYGLGRPFSPLYSLAMRIREYCYSSGVFRSTSVGVPVISVGNLTMGGTGKTPMVRWIARLLQQQGFQPAIVSRGYGGATRQPVNVVSDGDRVHLDAAYVGDEPRMLADSLPGVFVLTGVVRRLPAKRAVEMGADVLLLDDGFQHLAVRRDLDLVLFSASDLAGNSRVFPGGDLREPIRALHRCNGFVLTGTDAANRERAECFGQLLEEKYPGKPVFFSSFTVAGILQQQKGGARTEVVRSALNSHRCFAFCGIARPDGFRKVVDEAGVELVGFQSFPDHFAYRPGEVRHLLEEAGKVGATCLLCTEKDLVKLHAVDVDLPLYGVSMKVDMGPPFTDYILEHLEKK